MKFPGPTRQSRRLRMSALFPLILRKRRHSGHDGTHTLRHNRTNAAQQTSVLFDHSSARARTDFGSPACKGFANPRQARFVSPVGVRPSSARGGTVVGANEAQVSDNFIAAAMVRRMVDAIDHRHIGKIKRAHAF